MKQPAIGSIALLFAATLAGCPATAPGFPAAPVVGAKTAAPPLLGAAAPDPGTAALETKVLQPFYAAIAPLFSASLANVVDSLPPEPPYDAGKQVTPTGYTFNVANYSEGTLSYRNTYDVAVTRDEGAHVALLAFTGQVDLTSTNARNALFCTASSSATVSLRWRGTLTCALAADGTPQKTAATQAFTIADPQVDFERNSCASAFNMPPHGEKWDLVGSYSSPGFFAPVTAAVTQGS